MKLIIFLLPAASARIGSENGLNITLNNKQIGNIADLWHSGVIRYDMNRNYWHERDVVFDAATMKSDATGLKLTVPAENATRRLFVFGA